MQETAIMNENFAVAILSGGQGRRIGFQNKPLLKLGSDSLISIIIKKLEKDLTTLLISANDDLKAYESYGYPVLLDLEPIQKGPLAGILSAMYYLRRKHPNISHLITVAGDTPFFPDNYVSSIITASQSQSDTIIMAQSNGRTHPVFSLWPITLYPALEKFMRGENYKVRLFAEQYKVKYLDFSAKNKQVTLDPFFNINYLEEYEHALKLFSQQKTNI